MQNKKKKNNKRKASKKHSSVGLIILLVVLLLLIAGYGTTGLYFSTHFLPGTTLNNSDVSNMTLDEAKQILISSSDKYKLTLIEQDYNKEVIEGSDVGLKAVVSDEFNKLLNMQSGLAWILNLFEEKDYTLDEGIITYTYDEKKLDKVIDKLECVDPQYPVEAKDAELVLMDGEFKIIPESVGNTAQRDLLEDKIKYAIESQEDSIDLEEEQLYELPTVYSNDPDLIAKKSVCDEIVDMKITLKFGSEEDVADIQTISTWVKTKKQDDGSYTLNVNEKKITEYVEYLAETYNDFNSQKTFVTHDGDTIQISPSYYGWLLDNEYAVEELSNIVKAKESVTLDLTDRSEDSDKWWIRVAEAYDVNNYYGKTYAEVSIDQQYMWMYQDGKVVLETPVVTGNPSLGNDTPKGVYRIIYQEKNATLKGPGYSTPVAYWMVFADDVGFHDATWQASFGGDRYTWAGSHGCVNMPLDKAGELYDLIYVNMAVFVY